MRVTAASPVHDLRQKAAIHRSVPVQRRRHESGIDRCGNTAVDQGTTITRYVDHTVPRDLDTSACASTGGGAGTDRAASAATATPVGHSRSGAGPSRSGRSGAGSGGASAGRPGAGYQESGPMADGPGIESVSHLDHPLTHLGRCRRCRCRRHEQIPGSTGFESGGPGSSDPRVRGSTRVGRSSRRCRRSPRTTPNNLGGSGGGRGSRGGHAVFALQRSPSSSYSYLAGTGAAWTVSAHHAHRADLKPGRVNGSEANVGRRLPRRRDGGQCHRETYRLARTGGGVSRARPDCGPGLALSSSVLPSNLMRRSLAPFRFSLGFHTRRTVASVCPLDEQKFVIRAKVRDATRKKKNRRVSTIRFLTDLCTFLASKRCNYSRYLRHSVSYSVQVWQNVIYNVRPADKAYLTFGKCLVQIRALLTRRYLTRKTVYIFFSYPNAFRQQGLFR